MKRIAIASLITVVVLATSGIVVSGLQVPEKVVDTQGTVIAQTTEPEIVETPTAPVIVAEPAVPPAKSEPAVVVEEVRTFAQIILDYPNMSGDKMLVECSNKIYNHMPYRFTPDVIEKNVKLVSEVFGSSCAALGGNRHYNYLDDRDGSGDFFTRFANRSV